MDNGQIEIIPRNISTHLMTVLSIINVSRKITLHMSDNYIFSLNIVFMSLFMFYLNKCTKKKLLNLYGRLSCNVLPKLYAWAFMVDCVFLSLQTLG